MASAWINRSLACVCLLAVFGTTAIAQESWKVDERLLGETKGPPEYGDAEDISGIACDNSTALPRLCLVVDDETQGAQIVILKEGELHAGAFIPLTIAQYAGEPVELDAEAVAYDAGYFYVVGSHGRPRREEKKDPKKQAKRKQKEDVKAAASRQMFRIALPPSAVDMKTGEIVGRAEITPSSALATILQGQSELSQFYDRPLDDNGVTIEGLAVRDQQLFIGLRGPVLGPDAVVLVVPESAVFDQQPKPKTTLHRLALDKDAAGNPRGIRDLARYRDGFLVLAGPVSDPDEDTSIKNGDYAIYSWDGDRKTTKRADLKVYKKDAKPEALLPLDGDAERVRVLLMFDGPDNGRPTSLEVSLK